MHGLLGVGGRLRYAVKDERDAANPLVEHLGQILQVRHLSVLMGSGASFHLGSPQIRNLNNTRIAELVEDVGEPLTKEEAASLSAVNPDDDGDLEVLLSTLQSALGFAAATASGDLQIRGESYSVKTLRTLRRKLNRSLAEQCRLPREGYPRSGQDPWHAHQTFFARLLTPLFQ